MSDGGNNFEFVRKKEKEVRDALTAAGAEWERLNPHPGGKPGSRIRFWEDSRAKFLWAKQRELRGIPPDEDPY